MDRTSEARLEYWNGEIFDMSGGSKEHDRIEEATNSHTINLFPASLNIC
jgi:hypothetical protein